MRMMPRTTYNGLVMLREHVYVEPPDLSENIKLQADCACSDRYSNTFEVPDFQKLPLLTRKARNGIRQKGVGIR